MTLQCSECGGCVIHLILTVDPPKDKWECQKCGRVKVKPRARIAPETVDMSESDARTPQEPKP